MHEEILVRPPARVPPNLFQAGTPKAASESASKIAGNEGDSRTSLRQ
jgi:hypothetical protein